MPKNRDAVLVVDNRPIDDESDRMSRIKEVVESFAARPRMEVVHFKDLRENGIPPEAKAIILSGSSYNASEFDKPSTDTFSETNAGKDFRVEMDIMKRANEAILAICFAHTLVARTFGGEVRRNEESSEWNRPIRISVRPGDEFLKGEYVVDVNHKDYVPPDDERIREYFHIRSISTDRRDECIRYVQYMRHRHLPIYSVQFHPETHDIMPDGYEAMEEDTFARAKREGEKIIHRFLELALSGGRKAKRRSTDSNG